MGVTAFLKKSLAKNFPTRTYFSFGEKLGKRTSLIAHYLIKILAYPPRVPLVSNFDLSGIYDVTEIVGEGFPLPPFRRFKSFVSGTSWTSSPTNETV
jgi:hypothetical protein